MAPHRLALTALPALLIAGATPALAVTDDGDELLIGEGETHTLGGERNYAVRIVIDGTLNVTGSLTLVAPVINVSGTINADAQGDAGGAGGTNHAQDGGHGGQGPGAGGRGGASSNGNAGGGGGGAGSYGGAGTGGGHGGDANDHGAQGGGGGGAGSTHGAADGRSISVGSGGGGGGATTASGDCRRPGEAGGRGGGSVRLVGDDIDVNGLITATGAPGGNGRHAAACWNHGSGGGGGASGGGILIEATSRLSVDGTLRANGGLGGAGGNGDGSGAHGHRGAGGGGGGGGRIKLFAECVEGIPTLEVAGGARGDGSNHDMPNGGVPGGEGTTHIPDEQQPQGCECEEAPEVDLGGDLDVTEGAVVELRPDFSEACGDELQLHWSFGDGAELDGDREADHAFGDEGEYEVVLTVTVGETVTRAAITVRVSNVAPEIVEAPDGGVVDEGTSLAMRAVLTDAGDDELTYTWQFGDGTLEEGVDLTDVEHTYADNGGYEVTLTGDDGDGGTVDHSFLVQVLNVPPTPEVGIDQATDEGTVLALEGLAEDPGDDELTYTWDFGDGEVGAGPIVEHAWADDGLYIVELTVTDDDLGSGSDSFELIVVNVPPTVDLGPDRAVDQGDLVAFEGEVTDPGADELTYIWDFGDGAFGRDRRAFHTYDQSGTFTVTLTATDDEGGEGEDTLEITVQNPPPRADAGPERRVAEGTVERLVGDAEDDSPRGELTFHWDFGDGEEADGAEVDHAWRDDGEHLLTLTVRDPAGGVGLDTARVTVTNVAPAADAGPDLEGDEGALIPLHGDSTDPGEDPPVYTWLLLGLEIEGRDVEFAFPDDGVHVVTLRVEDGDGGVGEDTVRITLANVPPTIVSEPPPAAELGLEYAYPVVVVDPADDDELSLALEEAPEGMVVGEEGIVRWTPRLDQADGLHEVVLLARDDDGGEDRQAWTVEVPAGRDVDEDGMPDGWEQSHGCLDPAVADGEDDPDADGIPSALELAGGTDPCTSNAPGAPLGVSPEEGEVVATARPTLRVTNAPDPDGDPLSYEFEVSPVDGDGEPIAVGRDVLPGEWETEWLIEADLPEDAHLSWRARARDPWIAGPWSRPITFRVDAREDPPTAPVPLEPVGGVHLTGSRPTLEVLNSTDPDGHAPTYEFEVHGDEALSEALAASPDIPEEEGGVTRWRVSAPLPEGRMSWWRARATDPDGLTSPWSSVESFVIEGAGQGPEPPVITAPRDGEEVGLLQPELRARPAADAGGTLVTCSFTVAAGPRLWQSPRVPPSEDGECRWVPEPLADDTLHSLSVRARTATTASDPATLTFRVNSANDPPGAPWPLRPAGGVSVDPEFEGVRLIIGHATDPDGDPLTYAFELALDAEFTDVVEASEPIPESPGERSSWSPSATLEPGARYAWRARAVDDSGAEGPWSELAVFRIEGGLDSGEPEPDGTGAPSGSADGSWCSFDPDRGGSGGSGWSWLALFAVLARARIRRTTGS